MSATLKQVGGGRLVFSSRSGGTISFTNSPPSGGLYTFTTFVFSTASVTGNTGPTYNQIKTAYSATSWTQNQSYLDVVKQGFQLWTVPATGNYTIICAGAAGGNPSASNGLGNVISTTLSFTQGQKLQIVVGQKGSTGASTGNGGGGGSFVFQEDGTILVAAGGGGGHNSASPSNGYGICGTSGSSGTKDGGGLGTGGTGGNGGTTATSGFTSTYGHGGSGAGVLSDGGYITTGVPAIHGKGGSSYANGLLGGAKGTSALYSGGDGGFGGGGGGGAGTGDSRACCGGAGGYSGGAGGSVSAQLDGGGGGGSYSTGTITAVGRCTSNGYIRITKN